MVIMVGINGVAIYKCIKEEGTPEALGIKDSSEIELEENETIMEVASRLVENIIDDPNIGEERKTPKYGRGKSARIHEFSDEVNAERENSYVTKDVLDDLRNGGDLSDSSYALAEWYITETQSRSDLLLVIPYTYDDQNFVAIIKTPYLDDAYETDPSDILTKAEEIIQRKTHKSLIYPWYDRHEGVVDENEAKVYQSGGSYADYWWGFVKLHEKKVQDEELLEVIADGEGALANVSSTSDFQSLPDTVEDDSLLDGNVKIEIGGIEVDVPLTDLAEDRVQLAKKDNTYFVILSGGVPDIQAQEGSRRHDVFPNLSDFDDIEDVVDSYL